jgi:pimeloyl-ACP methyl ester carboxylesterase
VVAGDGFGALIALDLLKRHPALVSAVALREPPLFAFVPAATPALADQRRAIEEAVREHGPEAGVDVWLGGAAAPGGDPEARARARAAHRAFFADYAGLASWPVTRRELRALAAPAVVVTGPGSPPPVVAAAECLAGLLPDLRRAADGDLAAAARALLGAAAPRA